MYRRGARSLGSEARSRKIGAPRRNDDARRTNAGPRRGNVEARRRIDGLLSGDNGPPGRNNGHHRWNPGAPRGNDPLRSPIGRDAWAEYGNQFVKQRQLDHSRPSYMRANSVKRRFWDHTSIGQHSADCVEKPVISTFTLPNAGGFFGLRKLLSPSTGLRSLFCGLIHRLQLPMCATLPWMAVGGGTHLAKRRRFCTVAARVNSSLAPLSPRNRRRSNLRMRFR